MLNILNDIEYHHSYDRMQHGNQLNHDNLHPYKTCQKERQVEMRLMWEPLQL